MPPLIYRSSMLSYRPQLATGSPALTGGLASRPRTAHAAHVEEVVRDRNRVVQEALKALRTSRKRAPGRARSIPSPPAGAFIAQVYGAAGHPLPRAPEALSAGVLYRIVSDIGYSRGPRRPQAGDLAFFHHTRDANANGKVDDELTHVALVERVDADGTVNLLHHHRGLIHRMVVNPLQPHLLRREGKRLNTYLRPVRRGDPPDTPHLSGEMLAGFVTLLR